jgi:hypothetical protein
VRDKILKYLWIGVLVAGLVLFALYVRQAIVSLNQPYPFEYGEGWDLLFSNWWGNGGIAHILPSASLNAYFTNVYPPVYFLVVGILFKLFGVSLFWGRLVSFISCLASGLVCFFIVKKVTGSRWWGILAGVLFFAPPITRDWTLYFKPEPLALFFSLLGIYFVVKFIGTKKILWSVPVFLLAVFTKQSFIAAPIAVGLFLLITKRKVVFWYSGLLLAGGLGLAVLVQWLSKGSFLFSILKVTSGIPVYWQLAVYLIEKTVSYHWAIIFLALCVAVLTLVRPKDWRSTTTLIILYFLVSGVEFAATTGLIGIWYSFSLEVLSVAMMLIPILGWKLSKLEETKSSIGLIVNGKVYSNAGKALLQGVVPLLLIVQLVMLPSFASGTPINSNLKPMYNEGVKDIVSVGTKPVISEDVYLLYLAGRYPIYEPGITALATRAGTLDSTPIISNINSKVYGLIILEWDVTTYYDWPVDLGLPSWIPSNIQEGYYMPYLRGTPAYVNAVIAEYQLKEHIGRLWIYEPKP